jgi:hypothetical protein
MRQGLVALDPKTGKVYFKRWFRARSNESVNASNPVVIGDHVFCSSAYYGEGAFVLKIKPDLSGATEVWSTLKRRATNRRHDEVLGLHWMTPIVHKGNLYAFSGRNEPDARFRCVTFATGKLLWNQDESWNKFGPPTKVRPWLLHPSRRQTHRARRNRQARPLCPQRQKANRVGKLQSPPTPPPLLGRARDGRPPRVSPQRNAFGVF